MSSNEDQSAVRDREEKETEEVEVGWDEAVGGGGEGPTAGGDGGSDGVGGSESPSYTDQEVLELPPANTSANQYHANEKLR